MQLIRSQVEGVQSSKRWCALSSTTRFHAQKAMCAFSFGLDSAQGFGFGGYVISTGCGGSASDTGDMPGMASGAVVSRTRKRTRQWNAWMLNHCSIHTCNHIWNKHVEAEIHNITTPAIVLPSPLVVNIITTTILLLLFISPHLPRHKSYPLRLPSILFRSLALSLLPISLSTLVVHRTVISSPTLIPGSNPSSQTSSISLFCYQHHYYYYKKHVQYHVQSWSSSIPQSPPNLL